MKAFNNLKTIFSQHNGLLRYYKKNVNLKQRYLQRLYCSGLHMQDISRVIIYYVRKMISVGFN